MPGWITHSRCKERATVTDLITTIGCDLGDKTSSLFVMEPDGREARATIKTTRAAFKTWFTRAPAHVVVEAGTHSPWVSRLLATLGHTVTVANPRKLQLISQNESKSDANDPVLLARLGRADVKLLSPIQHRSAEAQADLAVPRARDGLVAARTKLINCCRGVVKGFGVRLPKCDTKRFHRQAREAIPVELMPALSPVLEVLAAIDEAIKAADREVARLVKKYPDVAVISQPSGVGVLTALVFLLTLEKKERFASSRAVGAYLGLRPKRSASGESDPQLGITKMGNELLRKLLVQCAHYILGPFGTDSDLRRWGKHLGARGGKGSKKRAVVALARKLAVLMHRLWVTGEEYEPLRQAKKHEGQVTLAAS